MDKECYRKQNFSITINVSETLNPVTFVFLNSWIRDLQNNEMAYQIQREGKEDSLHGDT